MKVLTSPFMLMIQKFGVEFPFSSWKDLEILQNDVDSLFAWAKRKKMRFHPKKCKAVTVTSRAIESCVWNVFPFQSFYYALNGIELDVEESEKDLGVLVTSKIDWEENVLALCTKASSRLGVMKRTLHFVRDRKQKRAFYLSLVRSLFEHCSVAWRESNAKLSSGS